MATGLRLHVVEWGDPNGWPVMILHGGGHAASCWADVCRRLPAELRCIVPDQRGHGASDRSPLGDYSCAAQVDDLVALLRLLAMTRCAVVGHSMGGLTALHFAGRHPERVTALVLIDVGSESRRSGLERVRRRHASSAATPGRETTPGPFDTRLLDFVPSYGGDEGERRRLLAATRAPLLVVRGEHSRILSPEGAARTASFGKGSTVAIPDAGHNVSLDNPEAVAEALRDFLLPLARRGA